MFSLNAAYAAVVGVCNELEHTLGHAAYFGQHSHEPVSLNSELELFARALLPRLCSRTICL